MALFLPALSYLLEWEAPKHEYVPSLDNNGYHVIAGINERWYPAAYNSILKLPKFGRFQEISNFYKSEFWHRLLGDQIKSQDIANRLMDMAVNAGYPNGVKLFQRTLISLGASQLKPDGLVGDATIAATNALDSSTLLSAWRKARLGYYADISGGEDKILAVWRRRAMA